MDGAQNQQQEETPSVPGKGGHGLRRQNIGQENEGGGPQLHHGLLQGVHVTEALVHEDH